jgi:hypothetical protein
MNTPRQQSARNLFQTLAEASDSVERHISLSAIVQMASGFCGPVLQPKLYAEQSLDDPSPGDASGQKE